MPAYMLDTDIFSYIMNRTSGAVQARLHAVGVSDVCISAIVKCELAYGAEVSPRKPKIQAALDAYLKEFAVLDFPSAAAVDYGEIRADLKAQGTPIGANDLLIAAHARCLGLTLVTNNIREFGRVKGLKVDNWA